MSAKSVPLLFALLAVPAIAAAQDPERLQMACAPMSLSAPPIAALRVRGGRERGKMLFAAGEALIVGGGARQGVRVGQEFYVRRTISDRFMANDPKAPTYSIHTTGWVRIVDVQDSLSVATVLHACDGIMEGDYLEPFSMPVVPAVLSDDGAPDFEHPARIVMGDERRQVGGEGVLMLIDRGGNDGVRPGQRLTVYRPTLEGTGPVLAVGTGTVLSVRPRTSLMRIDASSDAVYVGDLAALHR